MRSRCTWALLPLLAACDQVFPPPFPETTNDLAGFPQRIELGAARVGESVVHDFVVRNREDDGLLVELVTAAPFEVEPDRFVLGPNEARRVRMRFTASAAGPMEYALGLQLRAGLETIEIRGEGVPGCDDWCQTELDGRCVPHNDGGACHSYTTSPSCTVGGICDAGTCVPRPAPDGMPCNESCGMATCDDGTCRPDGQRVLEPEWTLGRNGSIGILEANEERIVAVVDTAGKGALPALLVLAPDGTAISISEPIDLLSWRGARVVGDALLIHRESRWRAYGLASGALRWVESGSEQRDQPIVDGTLYFANGLGGVQAVDVSSGATHWTTSVRDAIAGSLGSFDDADLRLFADRHSVFVLANDFGANRHVVVALDAASGAERWTRADEGVLDQFLPDDEGGYLAGSRDHDQQFICCGRIAGRAFAVDASGNERWGESTESALSSGGWVVDGPARLVDELVYLAGTDARDRLTGAWRYEVPVAGNALARFVTTGGSTFALDACTRGDCASSSWRAVVAYDTHSGALRGTVPIAGELDGFAGGPSGTALVGAGWRTSRNLCEIDGAGALVRELRLAGPQQWPNGSGVRAGDRWISVVYDGLLERSVLYAWRLAE